MTGTWKGIALGLGILALAPAATVAALAIMWLTWEMALEYLAIIAEALS